MANARQKRGSDLRIRSQAKAQAADRLLLAAQEAREAYDHLTLGYNALPKRRWIRRRRVREARFTAAVRHMQAIVAAQDIAKKGRYANVD